VSSADRRVYRRSAIALAALFVVSAVLFTLWPNLDIAASRPFFTPGAGFPAVSDPLQVTARYTIWAASEVVFVLSALAWLILALRGRANAVSARALAFVVLLYAAGPLLLVNGILKQFSGRARPADIAEFGGVHHFSPALSLSDQCQGNCSFVSGEAAAAVALSIAVVVLVETLAQGRARTRLRLLSAASVLVAIAASAMRILAGRHFLSDTVFAAIFVCAIGLALHRWLLSGPAAPRRKPPSPGR
jgi:lipid A 4'-phosphatase